MKTIIKKLGLFIFLFALASCQDVIELDVEDSAVKIVIDGRITNSSPNYVEISTTAGYFDQGATNRVNNAAVVLYEDGDTVAILSPDSIPGLYSTPYQGIEGKEYEVKDGDVIHFRFNV